MQGTLDDLVVKVDEVRAALGVGAEVAGGGVLPDLEETRQQVDKEMSQLKADKLSMEELKSKYEQVLHTVLALTQQLHLMHRSMACCMKIMEGTPGLAARHT